MKHRFDSRSRLPLAMLAVLTFALMSLNVHAAPPAPAPVPAPIPTLPAGAADDIRDIRGPIHIESPWSWLPWIAGGALVAMLSIAAWRRQRNRALRMKLPFERALENLEKIRGLMQPENAREFSIAVSEIVRVYIEERFEVFAAHRTTEEFLHDLLEPSDALLAGHRAVLAEFLRHCDLAKFARWILSTEEMEGMHASARKFILETRQPVMAALAPQLIPAATHYTH